MEKKRKKTTFKNRQTHNSLEDAAEHAARLGRMQGTRGILPRHRALSREQKAGAGWSLCPGTPRPTGPTAPVPKLQKRGRFTAAPAAAARGAHPPPASPGHPPGTPGCEQRRSIPRLPRGTVGPPRDSPERHSRQRCRPLFSSSSSSVLPSRSSARERGRQRPAFVRPVRPLT